VRAGDVLHADEDHLEVSLDDVQLQVEFPERIEWPLRLGAGGIFSALPYLGQYWHPHVLGGRATGEFTVAGQRWDLDGADVYAEKNWGAGFPDWWWWGQAQGFSDPDLCVAFGGGHLTAGRLGVDIGGCVLRVGDEVVRFASPASVVRTALGADRWSVRARRPGWRLELEGSGGGRRPAVLPVPLPAERRNVARDLEHLAGTLHIRAWRRGRLVVDDESRLAGLEVGSTDPQRFSALAADHAVAVP
jgi:tocopherol cyclase